MKRKKLLDFARWLETAGGEFDVMNACKCISWQACKWNGDLKRRKLHSGSLDFDNLDRKTELVVKAGKFDTRPYSMREDLKRIFDIDETAAQDLYLGWPHDRVTRKQAAKAVRTLARKGKVNWYAATA